MTDSAERQLERAAVASGFAPIDMARLKAAWARSLVWRECLESGCKAQVPDLAWNRHTYRHEHAKVMAKFPRTGRELSPRAQRDLDNTPSVPSELPWEADPARAQVPPGRGPMPVIPLPAGSPIGARPRKSPLWHRLVVQPGQHVATFFRDAGGQIGLPFSSQQDHRGSLPRNCHFFAYGMSLLPDPGASLEQVLPVYTTGELHFVFSSSVLLSPAARLAAPHGGGGRLLLVDEVMKDPTDDEVNSRLEDATPMVSLTISGRPVEIASQGNFGVQLIMPDPPPRPTGFIVVLHGISLRGITS